MYSCGMYPPLLNGLLDADTTTPQTWLSRGSMTAYPPNPPACGTGVGVGVTEGVGVGVGAGVDVSLFTGTVVVSVEPGEELFGT